MDSSPFVRLPGELRNKIWRFVLVEGEEEALDVVNFRHAGLPAILATCRQIRTETSSIFYAENTFRLLHPLYKEVELSWFQLIGPQCARRITTLVIVPAERNQTGYGASVSYDAALRMMREVDTVYDRGLRKQAAKLIGRLKDCGLRVGAVQLMPSAGVTRTDAAWSIWKGHFDDMVLFEKGED